MSRIQLRRGTAAQWTAANPVLYAGEFGFETDTIKIKVGDGSHTWNDLNYFPDWANIDCGSAASSTTDVIDGGSA